MKKHITMRKLMQDGWIPVLTVMLCAGIILSLTSAEQYEAHRGGPISETTPTAAGIHFF